MTKQGIRPPARDGDIPAPEAGRSTASAKKLKIDFHTHTGEDRKDFIHYTARDLIDAAAARGFDALAITNHDMLLFTPELERYAAGKGILLIPGIEITADGCHVVIINPRFSPDPKGYTLAGLHRLGNEESLIIAPHPFFHLFKSLKARLFPLLGHIDAVEFTCYHNSLLNLNKKGVLAAREHGKTLVGNSDSHKLKQFGMTYTLVESEKNTPAIVRAVKAGHCEVRTRPMSVWTMVRIIVNFLTFERVRRLIDRRA